MSLRKDDTFDNLSLTTSLQLPTTKVAIGTVQVKAPGAIIYDTPNNTLYASDGREWSPVGIISNNGITTTSIGPTSEFPTLLAALQAGHTAVKVAETFTDTVLILGGDYPPELVLFILPGVVYTYSGVINISAKRLIILGAGKTSVFHASSLTTVFTSNLTSSMLLMNCTYRLGTINNDGVLASYLTFDTRNVVIESINPTASSPMVQVLQSPAACTLINTTFISASSAGRMLQNVTGTGSFTGINIRAEGSFTNNVGKGGAIDLRSSNNILRSWNINSASGFSIAVQGGKLEQITSISAAATDIQLASTPIMFRDCTGLNVTVLTANCSISGSVMDVMDVRASNTRIVDNDITSLNISIPLSQNCSVYSNTIANATLTGGGGGIATDPHFVGNRIQAGVPVDISGASVGNQ